MPLVWVKCAVLQKRKAGIVNGCSTGPSMCKARESDSQFCGP